MNLPGIISLLAGGGADVCAGVFVLSCRLLLDMLKAGRDGIFTSVHSTSQSKSIEQNLTMDFNAAAKVLREAISWIFSANP